MICDVSGSVHTNRRFNSAFKPWPSLAQENVFLICSTGVMEYWSIAEDPVSDGGEEA